MATGSRENIQVTRWVLISFIVIVIAFAMWLIRDIVMLTLTAVILSVLLTAPVRFFVQFGVRRPVAVLLTLILVAGLVMLTTSLVLPGLLGQFNTLFTKTIPEAWEALQKEIPKLVDQFPELRSVDFADIFRQMSSQVVTQIGSLTANVTGQLFPVLGGVLSTVLSILIVIFLSVYFVADPDTHQQGFVRIFPISYRRRAVEVLAALNVTLRQFLKTQILLMVLTGLATGIALLLMGVPLPTALGTITGVTSFVPNFGPLVALVPILAVAISSDPGKIPLIVLIFYVIQFVMSQIIAPLLLGQSIQMPPAMILLSQIIAGIFFGFLGLLLAVPLAAIAMVLLREVYVKDILGDRDANGGTHKGHPPRNRNELTADTSD